MALEVKILSPSRIVARTTASQLQVPGILGYLGILPGHAPLIGELGIGELVVKGEAGAADQSYFVAGGYVDVADDKVTVLVDTVEKAADINVAQAEETKRRVEAELKNMATADYAKLNDELRAARERIAIATKKHH